MFLKQSEVGAGGNLELKGGENRMDEPTIAMEVERVMNLTGGFGWEKVKEEIVEDEILITMKKKLHSAVIPESPAGPS